MEQNITAKFPVLLFSERVYINEEFVVLKKGSERKEISFKNICGVVVQPLGWLYFIYRTNDVRLTIKNGESINLFNLSNNGINKLTIKIKENNPEVQITTIDLNVTFLINGIFRTRHTPLNGKQVPLKVVTIVVIVVAIILSVAFSQYF